MKAKRFWETIEVKGDALLDRVKELIAEGNVRRIRIRQHGRTIAEFPLTVGVVGDVERDAQPPVPVAAGDHAPADDQC